VRHLVVSEEILGAVLLTQHNVHLLLTLMREMRAAILDGTFEGYAENFLLNYNSRQLSTASNL
jgi:queuine tRNA-ribosyltransferase